MKIMSWNIGTERLCVKIEDVLEAVAKHRPEVLVLGGYSPQQSQLLETQLRELGYLNIHTSEPPLKAKGVMVASKLRCQSITYDYEPPQQSHRWKEVMFPDFQFRLLAVSVPEPGPHGKDLNRARFLQKLSEYCDFRHSVKDQVIITGDFAVDAVDHYTEIQDEDIFCRSIEMGWRDPWQEGGRSDYEPTYFPPGDARGVRRDRTLLSPQMAQHDCDYRILHLEREQGLTEHGIQMIDLRIGGSGPKATTATAPVSRAKGKSPRVYGYGKSAALQWAMVERVDDMLGRFGDAGRDPVVWFNPSFALGGKGASAVGYFDGIVMGDQKLLIVKGEWNGVGPVYDEMNIDARTIERHGVLRWYILNWKLGYSWDFFVRDMGEEYTRCFDKKMPSPDRIMARKLEKLLNRIHSQLDNLQEDDIIDVLLYVTWIRENEGVPDTRVFPESFELIRYDYPVADEEPYIEMPVPL